MTHRHAPSGADWIGDVHDVDTLVGQWLTAGQGSGRLREQSLDIVAWQSA